HLLEQLSELRRLGTGVFDKLESVGPHRVIPEIKPGIVRGRAVHCQPPKNLASMWLRVPRLPRSRHLPAASVPATSGRPFWLHLQRICSQRPTCLLCRRSEEHTSELQSQSNLVCRLL